MTTPDVENATSQKKENANGQNGASAEKADANSEGATSKKNLDATGQKATSQRKIEANRRNASRSPGPKTSRGKRLVSRNALRHGILVDAVVDMVHEERMEDFRELFTDLILEYEPQGRLEELLVERIATAFWKLKRVLQAEQGEIDKAILAAADRLRSAAIDKSGKDFFEWIAMVYQGKRGCDGETLIRNMKRTKEGIDVLSQLVSRVRNELESTGSLPDRNLLQLIRGVDDATWHRFLDEKVLRDPKEKKEVMLSILDRHLAEFDWLREDIRKSDLFGTDSEYRGASIPMGDAMDRILRYERHAERQLYRAMDQLERLQRRRRGESLPPPLKIEIERT